MDRPRYADKILPNQAHFISHYRDAEPYEQALYKLLNSYAKEFDPSGFKLVHSDKVTLEEMSTPPFELALLNMLIQLTNAKTFLEIGTFIGHSTMQIACMLGKDGHVTTIEVFKEFADIARTNFRNNGYEKRITLKEGSAGKILDELPGQSFDVVFVDGSKQDYLDYTLKSKRLVTPRGIIIVDDVFFHGDALNQSPTTEKGAGCKALLDHFRNEKEFRKALLPISNGVLVLFNRPGERQP